MISDDTLTAAVGWYLASGRSSWGFSEAAWGVICRQLVDHLEGLARSPRGMVFYKQLVADTDLGQHPEWHLAVSPFLQVLVKACHLAELPMLTSLVYGKTANAPGPGFHDAAHLFGYRRAADDDDLRFWFEEIARVRVRWR
ncbi:hypothetical protein NLX83_01725 [Allokutzneria sp. A3M-2-11 16]|uniref:hypothetical protein n=1 Tax=Allokutzneria sp. A3M-2-11 16 TaxID=2962043 RepID=UPI0020B8ED1C|nr:hypothetical protein [Allokutzneria sp. A3M-2-11 16]MCP3797968.1 hypothetical protein [Allokutzneria sp. A3M-2-11 16]